MLSALDMSLDDIIKNNKKSSPAAGGRGGAGPTSRQSLQPLLDAEGNKTSQKIRAGDYGVYTDQIAAYSVPMARVSYIVTGTKLYISNLDYGVSNDDIKEIFSEVDDIKRYSIHYDRSGRSKGTAEVVFARKEHALAAVKRYNNMLLDGKPMKIEVVGTNIEKPVAFSPVTNGVFGNPIGIPRSAKVWLCYSARERGGPAGRLQGGGDRGQIRDRGRGRGRGGDKVSATDLDVTSTSNANQLNNK